MSGTEAAKAASGQPVKEDLALQEGSDAVQMKKMETPTAPQDQDQDPATGEAGPSSSTQPDEPSESAILPDIMSPAGEGKGKGKEVMRDDDEDSMSIQPSGPGAAKDGVPVCLITLLLASGARHPYRIDEKYLAKREVDIPDVTESGHKDPTSISVYKLKELILREWREDWDAKPASPTSIRLIHFGKLLEDKKQLKEYKLSADSPNVVHMSVKPSEMEDDEAGKGKTGADGRNRQGAGRSCCVIL